MSLDRVDRLWRCTGCGYFAYSLPVEDIHDGQGERVGAVQHVCPVCPVCLGTGYAARYTASHDVLSPAVVGTTGHLLMLGPEHVCPNCKGAGRV